MRWWLFWACAWLAWAPARASGEGESGDGGQLVVATYNLMNYLSMDRWVYESWRRDYPKPESEKRVARETILDVAPDILALQEIGSLEHGLELQGDLAKSGLEYDGLWVMEAADEERKLGALWREGLVVEVVEHVDLTLPYFGDRLPVKRGLLELRVGEGAGRWSLFIAHLKSRYTNDPKDPESLERRTREARAIRDRVLELYPDPGGARFLVVGDLNDTTASRPLRAFRRRGDLQIAVPVPCEDRFGLTWTHFYQKEDVYGRVDYILRSTGWEELAGVRGVIHHRDDYYEGSDHRLVYLRIPGAALR